MLARYVKRRLADSFRTFRDVIPDAVNFPPSKLAKAIGTGATDVVSGEGMPSSEIGEVRYQQLFESSPLPLWVYDLETLKFLDVNEVACAKYGYSRSDFLSMTILDIRPPEDADAVVDSVRDTPTDQFNSGVWRHRLKTGEHIFVEITSHPMEFMGRRTRFVCPIDVTQRLRSEAALRRQEQALKRAQCVARLAHVTMTPDGRLEEASANLAPLAHLSSADLPSTVAAWIDRLVHPEDRDLVREATGRALSTGERTEMEYRLRQRDGMFIQIAQVFDPVEDTRYTLDRRWFSTLQDVTDQRQAEARLVRQAEELEERVRQRTAELLVLNRELAHATEQAQQASIAKSRFLSNVSHELRTPLNAILGFAQLLALNPTQALSASQQATYSGHILNAGNHLLALINELLDLAAIEAGKTAVSIEQLDLHEAIADCTLLLTPIAAQRSISMRAQATGTERVLGDRTRLKQVLLNLLSNAVKYSPDGAAVNVAVQRSGTHVRVAVTDQGAGMTPDQVAALYQPFNRLGRERGRTEGSGIGLVVTKSLVELMHGRIGVDSVPGTGSTFWVELPTTTNAVAPGFQVLDSGSAKGSLESPRLTDGSPMEVTVLCVDDDLQTLRLVERILSARAQVTVITAPNGLIGVELARRYLPSVIVIDNNMPEMTGVEARGLLLANPATAGIPVIALSANPPQASDYFVGSASVFRSMAKPLDVSAFLDAIDEAIAVSRPTARK